MSSNQQRSFSNFEESSAARLVGRATRELRNQHTLLEQYMSMLLSPITTEQELKDMIDNSKSNLWKDKAIDQKFARFSWKCVSFIHEASR